jgi:hypothetical protein
MVVITLGQYSDDGMGTRKESFGLIFFFGPVFLSFTHFVFG